MHYLTDRLPKPNYDNVSDPGHSLQSSPQMERNYKGSLPKLNKMLQPGLSAKLPDKRRKNGGNNGLMVEGRSKIIGDVRSQEKPQKSLDKEIRDELKKIYKVRQVGRSY